MYIKSFATLRSVLRRVEAKNAEDAITEANFAEWVKALRAAVDQCYANPIPETDEYAFDWNDARANIRRVEAPRGDALQVKIRRAVLDEICRPAVVLLKSDKKNTDAKAFHGVRTCVVAASSGLIRVFADRSDDAAASKGTAGKLRVLAYALQTRDARAVVARLAEAFDPACLLHLELGAFLPASRVVSHEGSSRFQQAFDHHRPVPVNSLTVTFSGPVAGPPPIQTVFVNEQLVDAFWEWIEPEADDADEELAVVGAVKQTIKFAKAQRAVRSWSVVVSSDAIVAVDADIDVKPTVLTPALAAINGNARNLAEIVVAPGGLTTAPLLRDVVTATLRHFHGAATQERVVFAVQQRAVESEGATVVVGAARGAARTATFSHAGARVQIVEAADASNAAAVAKAPKVRYASKRAVHALARALAIKGVLIALALRFLRGWKVVAGIAAAIALVNAAVRHVTSARRLVLGAPLPLAGRTAAGTRRFIAVLAHALARAACSPSNAVTTALRRGLVAALRARALPLGGGCAGDVEAAIVRISEARPTVAALKPDALAAMGVGKTFADEDEDLVAARGAIAAMMYAETPELADALLPAAVAKDVRTACARNGDGVAAACDVLLRQASLMPEAALMQAACRSDEAGTVMLPTETLRGDAAGLRTFVFAADRSGIVAPLDDSEAKLIASALFPTAL